MVNKIQVSASMVWRNDIIIVDKQRKTISALFQTGLFLVIFTSIWKLTPLIGLFELDSQVRGQLFRAIIAICMTPLLLLPYFMFFKTYKIDLYNNELTISNDILFWVTRRKEKLTGRRTYSILESRNGIHSTELIIKLNDKKITVSKELHSSDLAELSNYLEQHGFEKSS